MGANPTDQGKNGRKRSLLVDARGIPRSLIASGANVHDVKLLEPTLDRTVLAGPEPDPKRPRNLFADAGYKGDPAFQAAVARNYQPHIKQRKEEADAERNQPGWKARRWVGNEPIPGSIAIANCWSASKKRRPATSPCFPWPRP